MNNVAERYENNEESILISDLESENKEFERESGFLEKTKESKSNTSSIGNISETSDLELEHETPEQESLEETSNASKICDSIENIFETSDLNKKKMKSLKLKKNLWAKHLMGQNHMIL